MLNAVVRFALRFRGVVIALGVVVLVYGAFVAAHAKFDVFPEFAPPQVVIQTEAPGLSPEQVETLVTRPVEAAINGVTNLVSIRSQSIQGLSLVTAVFRENTDIYRARQMAAERLVQASSALPAGVGPPVLAPLTSSTGIALVVGLTSAERTPMALRTFADWTLRPQLLAVPGVAKVVVYGGDVRELQIQVHPQRLVATGLSLDDVLAAARQATGVRGAGFVDTGPQRIVMRSEGQAVDPQVLGQTIIAQPGGVPIRLADVADVVAAPEPKFGDAAIMGVPGVALQVVCQYGANTLTVTRAVERLLGEMRPLFDAERITLHPRLFRPADFIETAIHNVQMSLLIGCVLVALVLFALLLDLRTAFVSLTAIPLSLLGALIVLDRLGVTLNTMTLGGLAIAIGEVVDDAIIDVENILRRLRENEANGAPRSRFRVVLDASLEVRGAVVYATFIVAIVFVPVLTMSGIQGRFFTPLGLAYILAILASLVVALTVTPALSFLMLRPRAVTRAEPPLVRFLKRRYQWMLLSTTARPRTVITTAAALCLVAIAMLPLFGGAFLPEFREGNFILHMSAAPGTSLRETMRIGREVARTLLASPHVHSITQRAGRAELGDDVFGTHYSESDVVLEPLKGDEGELVADEIRAALHDFPGVYFALTPFLTERIEETLSGATAAVVIKIFGDDLDTLDRIARQVSQRVASLPGAADVQVLSPPGTPQTVIRLRRDRLVQLGVRPLTALDAIQTAYQGTLVGQSYEGNRVFDVAVILDPRDRQAPESIGALLIRSQAGARVPLRAVADIESATGPYAILHDGAQRYQAVTCNVSGRDVAGFARAVRRTVLDDVAFPKGFYPRFAGTAEARGQAQQELLLHAGIVLVGVIGLLAIALGRRRNLVLVLANLPFALVGGVLAVFALGGLLSIGTLVGFVTLFGITVRNAIMLVSHYEHLVVHEGMTWGLEAALRGASERLIPILATAVTTALGLLPLAIGTGDPGREIEGPMAIVILGGLATSTVLNLLVLPTLALRFGAFDRPQPSA